MLSILILLLGVLCLVFGANFLVDGASVIAKKFNIPNIVIGLTIVAFGTSAPELVVNVISAVEGHSAITLGNVIGSNIINILIILGITSIIYPLHVSKNTIKYEIPISIVAAILALFFSNDIFLGKTANVLTRIDSWILLLFFAFFLIYNTYLVITNKEESQLVVKNYSVPVAILVTVAGFLLLVYGGKAIVNSAVELARNFGISERIISLTIVSLGTSLPELATSIVAAFKKNADIAIGNVVGSNIFNIFFILGVSGAISPIAIPENSNLDLIVNVLASILLLIFVSKEKILKRVHGIAFVGVYCVYLFLMFTLK